MQDQFIFPNRVPPVPVSIPGARPCLSGRWTALILLSILFTLTGCASPSMRLAEFARQQQLSEDRVASNKFEHVIYRSADTGRSLGQLPGREPTKRLHVYLEGDGLPWLFRYIKMKDPTPRRALMLELMAKDRTPSLYIGRPCYNGLYAADGCDVTLWTSARYSPQVVNSMAVVLRKEIELRKVKEVALFGHSGGGALAMLMAEQIPEVSVIITLAGNLDTDAWIRHHSYSPLYTSLNPAQRPELPGSILQVHYSGGRDSNIPPSLNAGWINAQRNSFGIAVESYTHSCCWAQLWPAILSGLNKSGRKRFPGYVFKLPGRTNPPIDALSDVQNTPERDVRG